MNIVSIGWKGTSEFDHTDSREQEVAAFKNISTELKAHYFQPKATEDAEVLEEIQQFVTEHFSGILLSQDHAVTYAGLAALPKQDLGLIVFDQHMDIYSYLTQGSNLNRANVFRKALDSFLVKHIVFVGVRPSELALKKSVKGLPDHINEFTEKDRKAGIFAGLEGKVSVISTLETTSFADGLKQAMKILNEKNIKKIGIDIDLDVFDSAEIVGVEYNNECAQDLIKKFLTTHQNEKIKPLLELETDELEQALLQISQDNEDEEIQELLDAALWCLQQQSEQGISTKLDIDHTALTKLLEHYSQELVYRGITEYIPSNDSNGKTKEMVTTLVAFLQ